MYNTSNRYRLIPKGVPFLGEETNKIIKKINESKITKEYQIDMLSLMDIAQNDVKTVVVIEDNNIGFMYITYLRDIMFNYRDKKVLLPYYTFNMFKICKRKKEDGHTIKIGDNFYVKYNYKLNCIDLSNPIGKQLIIYDIEKNIKSAINIVDWVSNNAEFSIDLLYYKYCSYCKYTDEYELYKHIEGYTIIHGEINGAINNKESKIRIKYELPEFNGEYKKVEEYRDVREYKKVDFTVEVDEKPYKLRRLEFESYLYCMLRSNKQLIEDEYAIMFKKLNNKLAYIKIKNNGIALIIKNYWLNNYRENKKMKGV